MTGTSDSLFDQFYKVSTVNQGHNVFISLGKYIISVQRVWVNKERHWALEICLHFFFHLINDNIFWVRVFLSSRKERIFCSSVTLKSSSAHLPLHKNSLPILVHESLGAVYLYRELLRSSINNMETPSNPFALWLQRCLGI